MNLEVFFAIIAGAVFFFGFLFYLSDRAFQSGIKLKQQQLAEQLFDISKKLKDIESNQAEYRQKHIHAQESMADVHDHLAKVTDQMKLLVRGYKTLKNGMIQRYEVLLPNDFKKDIKTLADKMKKLNL